MTITVLSTAQVTGLTAQAAAAATYVSRDATGELLPDWYVNDNGADVYAGADMAYRGVGVYGQSPSNLVLVGVLKSSALNLMTNPSMTATVLNTPSQWTGLGGISSLADYLNAPDVQNQFEIALYEGAYQGLIDAGVIDGTESDRYIATFLQPAVQYGVNAVVAWLAGTCDPMLAASIEVTARQGQYAIDFVNTYGHTLNVAPAAVNSDNTVIRDQIDTAVTGVIDNAKIPDLIYANTDAVLATVAAEANTAATVATALSTSKVAGNVLVTVPVGINDDGTFRFAPGSGHG